MKKTAAAAALLTVITAAAGAQEASLFYSRNSFRFPAFLIKALPGAEFYPAFFENYAPDATFLVEESNGFSLLDRPRVFYEGDSFTQFHWYYGGFAIGSALEPGSPGVIAPYFSISDYELRGESPVSRQNGFHVNPAAPSAGGSRLRFSTAGSGLGSYVSWAPSFVNPHATKFDRDDYLYSTRRSLMSNYELDYAFTAHGESSALTFSLTVADLRRKFNDFGARDATFTEHGRLTLLGLNYDVRFNDVTLALTALFNDLSRDHDLAELGRYPQETLDKKRRSFFAGGRLKGNGYSLGLSFLREKESLTPATMNFAKDLLDSDGEGLRPFEPWGDFAANVFRLDAEVHLLRPDAARRTGLSFFSDIKASFLDAAERAFEFNPITFGGAPELVILWTPGSNYRSTNTNVVIGAMLSHRISDGLSFEAKLLLQDAIVGLPSSATNVRLSSFGYDLGLRLFKNPEILLAYEEMPYELRENVNVFLETRRPAGRVYGWTDADADGAYQPGEEGALVGTTGGPFHEVAGSLKAPMRKRILLTMSLPLSKTFLLSFKGLYKRIDNNLWVGFKDDYGFYEEVAGRSYFFYDTPVREYVLGNDPSAKKPFYAQFLFQLSSRDNERWAFSLSLLAHIGMGRTMFGNGPGANDIGLLDESQADPNSAVNAYGRVDGDRAYLAKLYFGVKIIKRLTLGADIKYRDGTPFAFLDTFTLYDQRVIAYRTIKGDNEQGQKGGPRKDFLSDVSLKLTYDFVLFGLNVSADATVFNLLDMGSELSEYIYGTRRFANELQLPRSYRLGLNIEF
jgi:hypothetical protein